MSQYQTVPQYVNAFQMTAEAQANPKSWPEWAANARALDLREIGAIFPTSVESPDKGYSIRTEYGEFLIPIDTWVVQGERGYMLMQGSHFAAQYQPVECSKSETKPEQAKTLKKEPAIA